ncbi:MAG: hypothetical protein H6611_04270 [Ignavibacteriales bacterium]|nr:hypothetical protein [Ignavibacteriales bacterium]
MIAQFLQIFITNFGGIHSLERLLELLPNIKMEEELICWNYSLNFTFANYDLFRKMGVKLIPMATLAAILVVVSYNMSEYKVFTSIEKSKVMLLFFYHTFLNRHLRFNSCNRRK